jgi:transcription-repair coupling factor (superfamily II helicase)
MTTTDDTDSPAAVDPGRASATGAPAPGRPSGHDGSDGSPLAALTSDLTGKIGLTGLSRPAFARLLAGLMEGELKGRRVLVLAATPVEAEDFAGDLAFFWGGGSIVPLPLVESRPFMDQVVSPGPMAERLRALHTLAEPVRGAGAEQKGAVVVASMAAAMARVPSPEVLLGRTLEITVGQTMDFEDLNRRLADGGYHRVGQVEYPCDYAVRGGLIDVWPAGCERPVRLDFFGDDVESIRSFRADDQKSVGALERAVLTPAAPAPRDRASLERGAEALESLAREKGWLGLLWERTVEFFRSGALVADTDNWGPLWSPVGATVFDYLGAPGRVGKAGPGGGDKSFNSAGGGHKNNNNSGSDQGGLLFALEPGRLREAAEAWWLRLHNHFQRLELEERPHLELAELFRGPDYFKDLLASPGFGYVGVGELPVAGDGTYDRLVDFPCQTNDDLRARAAPGGQGSGLLAPMVARVRSLLDRGFRVGLVLRTREQLKRLAELLVEYDLSVSSREALMKIDEGSSGLDMLVGQLSAGFVADYDRTAFISEEDVFGARLRARRRAAEEFRGLKGFASLKDLAVGDFVVHNEHGIGQYLGLESLVLSTGQKGDFLHLVYKGGDVLHVPVERFASVTKYVGATDRPPLLDKLGSGSWEKLKLKVKDNIREMAEELVKLYAQREVTPGHAFSERDQDLREFEAAFAYEATPDQERSIDEVLGDLAAPRPMDRLVCGDVGYGKTEVAMRAAFKVVCEGKQVAVLVPTTILAEQHERSFVERFKDWPVVVGSLSRFKKPPEQKKLLADLAAGRLDIVIGTHRLLQKDVQFHDLGLLVIDEEHRFGVKDKERLKRFRAQVDVLSMSATPIPRSLSMSLNGIRDMSVIETSPRDRLAVKTTLLRGSDEAVAEAIDVELARGGQVFLIHNRIKDIQYWVDRLKVLMPLTRFGVGHGRMTSRDLELVMEKFLNRQIDVWVSTTIVESGLDFPSANTIIIDQADRFGLAQLYQLRGRVGRGSVQAYCHLMVDDPDTLSGDARKRLKALLDHSDLGSGYQIALHDMQIRGSGNILGAAQSGQAALVGFEMYSQLMEQAVRELKNEPPADDDYEPDVVTGLPSYLPEAYAPDTEARLGLYRRLSSSRRLDEVTDISSEMRDRFGPPPPEAVNLLDQIKIKILLKKIRARGLEVGPDGLIINFGAEGPRDPAKILTLATSNPKNKLAPDGRLFVSRSDYRGQGRLLKQVREFLHHL